jgi:hypothetical protein
MPRNPTGPYFSRAHLLYISIINANNDCLIYLIVIIKSSIATSTVMRRKVKLIELTNSFLLWNYKFSYSFIIFTF